jgi:hypothetical protein
MSNFKAGDIVRIVSNKSGWTYKFDDGPYRLLRDRSPGYENTHWDIERLDGKMPACCLAGEYMFPYIPELDMAHDPFMTAASVAINEL